MPSSGAGSLERWEARQEWRMGPSRQCGKETCWSIYPSRSRVRWLRDCPQNALSKPTCETQLQDTSFLSPQRTLFPRSPWLFAPVAAPPGGVFAVFIPVLSEQMPQCFFFMTNHNKVNICDCNWMLLLFLKDHKTYYLNSFLMAWRRVHLCQSA